MNETKKPFWDRKKAIALLIAILTISLMVVHVEATPTTTVNEQAQFTIASWDYPDEYGQGMFKILVFENSTESWVQVGNWLYYYNSTSFDWDPGVGIKIRVLTTLNSTLTGASDVEDGRNYFRHNVTVTESSMFGATETVFSQQNFTSSGEPDEEGDLYFYDYAVVLNFIPLSGNIYTVTVTYEVYYGTDAGTSENHLADSGEDDYADSQVLDSTYWSTAIGSREEAEFYLSPTLNIKEFSYAFYGKSVNDAGLLLIQNDADGWVTLETIATGGDAWYNGTVSDADYFKTDNEIHFAIESYAGDGRTIECDYLEITSVSYSDIGWHEISEEAELFFNIPLDESGLNMLLIFLGLFMIPASTLYLAKGGKDEMSMDKFFYGLLAFVMGWALFLSGIGFV